MLLNGLVELALDMGLTLPPLASDAADDKGFCPTGPGGGIDNSCSGAGGGASAPAGMLPDEADAWASVVKHTGFKADEIKTALTSAASPGANSGNAEIRAKVTSSLLLSGKAVPNAALRVLDDATPGESADYVASISSGDVAKLRAEFANTPLYDLQVLGGMHASKGAVSVEAVCDMVGRTIKTGITTRTGSYRHELGHAIRSALGGAKGYAGRTAATKAIAHEYDVAMAKVKAAGLPHGTPLSHDDYETKYGVVGRRALDNFEENFAEHYRLYHRELYRDRNEGGGGKYLAQYRERHPGMAKIFDAHYTAALLGRRAKGSKKSKGFCPTGPGGGIDNSCGRDGGGGADDDGEGGTAKVSIDGGEVAVSKSGPGGTVEYTFRNQSWAAQAGQYLKDPNGDLPADAAAFRGMVNAIDAAAAGDWQTMEESFPAAYKDYPDSYAKESYKYAFSLYEKLLTVKQHAYYKAGAENADGWKRVSGTAKDGTFEDANGHKYAVSVSDDTAASRNEVLAAKLASFAGAAALPTSLITMGGKVGVARKLDGDAKPVDYHTAAGKAELAKDFAVHAWLSNHGAANSENAATDYSKALGGVALSKNATEFDSMRGSAGSPFSDMTPAQIKESAQKLAAVDDETIRGIVNAHHGGTDAEKAGVSKALIARRDDIVSRAAVLSAPTKPPLNGDKAADKGGDDKGGNATPPKGMVLPSKPAFTAVNSYTKKLDALEAAANTGDIEQVKGVYVNMEISGHYAKMMQTYKTQLLAAMEGGAKLQADTAPKGATPAKDTSNKPVAPQPKPTPVLSKPGGAVNPEEFPPKPTFSNEAERYSKLADVALGHAAKGDLGALLNMKLGQSGALFKWHSELVSTLAKQLHDAKPTAMADDYAAFARGVKVKAAAGAESFGHWNVVDNVGGVPSGLPEGKWMPKEEEKALHKAGFNAYLKLPEYMKNILSSYTGSTYMHQNDPLRSDAVHTDSKIAATALLAASVPIPEGTMIGRKYTIDDQTAHEILMQHAVGKVVSDKGILSTSTKQKAWNGNVHMHITVGPGVRGLPAEGFTSNKNEKEIMFAPNQRLLIQSVQKASGKDGATIIRAVMLPTHHNQYP